MRIDRVFVGLRLDPTILPPDCSLAFRQIGAEEAKDLLDRARASSEMVSCCQSSDAEALAVLEAKYGIWVPHSDCPLLPVMTMRDRMVLILAYLTPEMKEGEKPTADQAACTFGFRILSIMQDLSQQGWRRGNQLSQPPGRSVVGDDSMY